MYKVFFKNLIEFGNFLNFALTIPEQDKLLKSEIEMDIRKNLILWSYDSKGIVYYKTHKFIYRAQISDDNIEIRQVNRRNHLLGSILISRNEYGIGKTWLDTQLNKKVKLFIGTE